MPPIARPSVRPVVLVILDGSGCREATPDNAIALARKPNWDRLIATCPHTSIDASELAVGLPRGQMGNSEVGHLNIGAGRVIYQDYTRIDHAIETGEFARNAALSGAVAAARSGGATLHVFGLAVAGRRAQPRAADRRDGRDGRGRRRAARPRPRVSRRPRHAAAERRRLARRAAGSLRAPSRRTHRIDRRPLLRDGPRPALGARRRGVRPHRRRPRRPPGAVGAQAGLAAAYARGETGRVRPGHRDRRPRRPARDDGRRRRRRVHEFPGRPRPRADPRAD